MTLPQGVIERPAAPLNPSGGPSHRRGLTNLANWLTVRLMFCFGVVGFRRQGVEGLAPTAGYQSQGAAQSERVRGDWRGDVAS